jgi:hypothetical protein
MTWQLKIPGNTESDSSRDSFWLDPEGDPGHDDDQTGWNIGMEQVVPWFQWD